MQSLFLCINFVNLINWATNWANSGVAILAVRMLFSVCVCVFAAKKRNELPFKAFCGYMLHFVFIPFVILTVSFGFFFLEII